ncbi:MAG: iron-sulfur cluster assembly scaffold protein [Nevskiales bacterium]
MTKANYSPEVWARFSSPAFAGELAGAVVGEAGTPASRAVMRIYLRAENGRVGEARFKAYGCVSTIAAGDWVAQWACGKTLSEARGLIADQIARALNLAPIKRHCALLAEDALRAALDNMRKSDS